MNEYVDFIKRKLKNNYDLKYREIELKGKLIHIIYFDSICDRGHISKFIIDPLIHSENRLNSIDDIENEVSISYLSYSVRSPEDAVLQLLSGNVLIIFEAYERVISCEVRDYAHRNVEIPPTEAVIKGPREGFTESLNTNVSLIRKYLQHTDLKVENINIGKNSKTAIIVVYIDTIAPWELVNRIKTEIKSIKTEFALQGNHISEQLKTNNSFFDTIAYTEKPNVFVARISEGRVGILIEGDPFAISAPSFFMEKFQSPNDYAMNKYISNFIRIIRWISFALALFLPGMYVALIMYHYRLIPYTLAFRITIARAGIPFPAVVEIFVMTLFFQILLEAGVRLPQPVGQATSIVGALIIGDVAVKSGLASTTTVLLIALSSIGNFLIPSISVGIVAWSTFLVICSAIQGLPGYFIGFGVFCFHLAGLESVGYPFLYPLGTLKTYKFKENFLRGDLKDISKNVVSEDKKQ